MRSTESPSAAARFILSLPIIQTRFPGATLRTAGTSTVSLYQYWDQFHGERYWYTRKQLRPVSVRVELARMWKWMGFQWFVNHFDWYRRFWEHYMCFIVRG